MKNNHVLKRIRAYVLSRTWKQLKTLTKQQVIDALISSNNSINTAELKEFNANAPDIFKWLKYEWLKAQEDDFIQKRYMPAFRAAINPSLSSYTVNQVYEYTLAQGLSPETADRIYNKAVKLYHGERNG